MNILIIGYGVVGKYYLKYLIKDKRVNKIFQRLRLSLKQYLKFGVLNNDYPKQTGWARSVF